MAAAGMAHHLGRREVPAVALGLAQLPAPPLRGVPEDRAHALLRRRTAIGRNAVTAHCLPKSALKSDLVAHAAAGGRREYFHSRLCSVLPAGRVDGLLSRAGLPARVRHCPATGETLAQPPRVVNRTCASAPRRPAPVAFGRSGDVPAKRRSADFPVCRIAAFPTCEAPQDRTLPELAEASGGRAVCRLESRRYGRLESLRYGQQTRPPRPRRRNPGPAAHPQQPHPRRYWLPPRPRSRLRPRSSLVFRARGAERGRE